MFNLRASSRMCALAIAAVGIFPALPAQAAYDMFLKIDGISGESVDVVSGNTCDVQVCADPFDANQSSLHFDITYNPAYADLVSDSVGEVFKHGASLFSESTSAIQTTGGLTLTDVSIDITLAQPVEDSGTGADDLVDLQLLAKEGTDQPPASMDVGLLSVSFTDANGVLVDPSTYTVDNSTTAEVVPEPATIGGAGGGGGGNADVPAEAMKTMQQGKRKETVRFFWGSQKAVGDWEPPWPSKCG